MGNSSALVRRASHPLDTASARAIQQEYETLRLLDDPRIPTVLGHFAGQAALALSFAPGPTLAQVVHEHRRGRILLHAATVLDLVDDIAQALRHAHSRLHPTGRPVSHGHLSASSVRLGPDGAVQVLGFGRSLSAEAPGILAPERLTEAPSSPAADHWALGALLLQLLTGKALYEREGDVVDLASRLEGRVEDEIEPVARKHPGLGRLLSRLLAARPEQRFPDEGELVRTLQELRRSLPGPSDRLALAEGLATLQAEDAAAEAPPKQAAAVAPAPIRSAPIRSAPIRSAPIRSAPIRSAPIAIHTLPPTPEITGPIIATEYSDGSELEVTEPFQPSPVLPPLSELYGGEPLDDQPRVPRTGLMTTEKVAIGMGVLFSFLAALALLSTR